MQNEVSTMFACIWESHFSHIPYYYYQTIERVHEGIETSPCYTTADQQFLYHMNANEEWLQLQSLTLVKCERRLPDHTSREASQLKSSLP